MAKTNLILQILGTSDIKINGNRSGADSLTGSNLADIDNKVKFITEGLSKKETSIALPLIEKLIQQLRHQEPQKPADKLLFALILTDQREWAEKRHRDDLDLGQWRKIISGDGIWWKEILSKWFEQKKLDYYPLTFVAQKDEEYGVADWEKIAARITPFLAKYVIFKGHKIHFVSDQNQANNPIEIDKIIVQHSSGTPALTSALYLWGIEQKIAGHNNIEFVYISEPEEDCPIHFGKHWQWHLRLPTYSGIG